VELIDDGAHLELPRMVTANPWLQAFDWIRQNTPTDAYFALDPRYLAAPARAFTASAHLRNGASLPMASKTPLW